ncbi:SWI/SNF complex subunit SMARCC2 [Tetranychus urticae]|uniref:SWIRM domain-containing protein n=1 Tax=Tetranychus urticae TaxID=32264 RepID=T1KIS4_TETUR|nr:SWI/SNF complex subunit SMARCC2 [Tetranychus urticae]
MTIKKRREGGADPKFFESPDIINGFDCVRQWLDKSIYSPYLLADPTSAKNLVTLVLGLIQFQEDNLGRSVSKPPMTRLPMKCILDTKPGGGLCHILGTMFKFKFDQGWRKFDLQATSKPKIDKNLEMLRQVEKVLFSAQQISTPIVYIRPDVDEKLSETLKDIVRRHRGTCVDSPLEATHIVHNLILPNKQPDDLCRPVAKNQSDKSALIHWLYTPDSYDSWLNDVDLTVDPDPPHSGIGQREVEARWLLDTDVYNEWMNEDDYEVIIVDNIPTHTKKRYTPAELIVQILPDETKDIRFRLTKRKRSPSPSSMDKKRRSRLSSFRTSFSGTDAFKRLNYKGLDEDYEDLTKDLADPLPEPNIQEVHLPKFVPGTRTTKDNELAPIKGGYLTELDSIDHDDKLGMSDFDLMRNQHYDSETLTIKIGDDDENDVNQASYIVIPSYSSWFDYKSIHPIEKRALTEFFNNSNKSKTPEVYLAYRNFMIDSYRINPTEYLTVTACRRSLVGDVCAIHRVHSFLELWGLINFHVDPEDRPNTMGPPTTSHFNIFVDTPEGLMPIAHPRSVSSVSAPQQVLSLDKEVRSETDKKAKTLLGDSFGLRMDQYEQRNAAYRHKGAATITREWDEQEILLLLEAIEMYKDDWNKVCEHVGSRTQDECILQFLRLPIEDPYLEDIGQPLPANYQSIPFSKSGNPIMSTIAFLASVVDPRIAASAAKAAINEFARLKDEASPQKLNDASSSFSSTGDNNFIKDPDISTCSGDGVRNSISVRPSSSSSSSCINFETFGDIKETLLTPKLEFDSSAKTENDFESVPKTGIKEEIHHNGDPRSDIKDEAFPNQTNKDGVIESEHIKDKSLKDSQISNAASSALGAAAIKAKHLAAIEERKIKAFVAMLVDTQLKKLQLKLKNFEEMEAMLDKEKETLEQQKQTLIQERQQFHMEQLKAAESRARLKAQTNVLEPTIDNISFQPIPQK